MMKLIIMGLFLNVLIASNPKLIDLYFHFNTLIKMNGFEKGKIYRIIGEGVYYGSTIQKINRRLVNHKSKYNQYLQDNKIFCNISYPFRD